MYDMAALYQAADVQDAIRLRLEHPEAQIIAGGTDVLVQMREGKRAGKALLSIQRCDEMRGVTIDEEENIRIGSLTSFTHITNDPIIQRYINVLGEAVDMDGAALLSLAPDSVASVVQVSGVDPRVSEYIARSLLLASGYLAEAGEGDLSALRAEQARALAEAYDLDLPDTPEELATLLDEADAALAKDAESTMDVLGYGTEPVIPANTIEAPLDSDR